jgi:hypothetical protein
MTLTRKQLVIRAMTRSAHLKKGEVSAALIKATEAHSLRNSEFDSAEAAFQNSLKYAQMLSGAGAVLNLSLYRLAGFHVSESAGKAARLKTELERSELERRRAADAMQELSLRLHRLEELNQEEDVKVSTHEQASSQKLLDELVLARYNVN